jgi:hypothetical protein
MKMERGGCSKQVSTKDPTLIFTKGTKHQVEGEPSTAKKRKERIEFLIKCVVKGEV